MNTQEIINNVTPIIAKSIDKGVVLGIDNCIRILKEYQNSIDPFVFDKLINHFEYLKTKAEPESDA